MHTYIHTYNIHTYTHTQRLACPSVNAIVVAKHTGKCSCKYQCQMHGGLRVNMFTICQTSHVSPTFITHQAWKNMPMIAIIASLPLANSAASFVFFASGSEAVNTLNPKSPAAAGVPADWSWDTSQKAM